MKPLNVVKDEKKAKNSDLFDSFIIFLEIKIPNIKDAINEIK